MNPFVLLGAGSSKEAGIPTAVEMTRAMMDSFDQARNIDTLRVLRFVVGGLKMKQGIQNKDVFQEINIEELFASVEMLEKRHELEVAPFVAQWHSSVSEVERFRVHRGHLSRFEGSIRSIGRTIEKSLKNWAVIQKKSGSFGGANVSVDLSNPARAVRDSLQYIFDMVTRPPTGALFAQASQDMIESLSKMVWLDDAERVNYLARIIHKRDYEGKRCYNSTRKHVHKCVYGPGER